MRTHENIDLNMYHTSLLGWGYVGITGDDLCMDIYSWKAKYGVLRRDSVSYRAP